MKNFLQIKFILVLLFFNYNKISAKVSSKSEMHIKEESLNSIDFKTCFELTNDKLVNSFYINSKPVSKEIYDQKFVDAKIKDTLLKNNYNLKKLEAKLIISLKQKAKLLIKILELDFEKMLNLINKIKDLDLENFLESEDFSCYKDLDNNFSDKSNLILDNLNKMLFKLNSKLDYNNINFNTIIASENLTLELDNSYILLEKIFYKAINQAVEKCTDTRILKKILKYI